MENQLLLSQPKKPFAYQKPLINAVCKELENSDRCLFTPACGTGKTLMSWFVAKRLKSKGVIVVAPTLQLVSQTMRTWVSEMEATGIYLPVLVLGSDKSIGKDTNAIVTTNQEKVNDFLDQNEKYLIISTYKSNHLLCESGKEFDLCIYDESHESAGAYGKIANTLLQDDVIKIKKRLFLTATPKVLNIKKDDLEIISMDDQNIYGREVGNYNTRKAIEDGNLTDYKVFLIGHNKSISKIENDILGLFDEKYIKSIDVILAYTLASEIKKKGLKKLLCFHRTNKKAKIFQGLMQYIVKTYYKKLDYKVFYLDHTSKQSEKDRVLQEFKDCKNGMLCNSQLFYQGYDLPELNGVVFGDKMGSTIRIVQTVGRALRKSQGKEYGYVILPIDKIENAKEKGFKEVTQVLAALASQDEKIKHQISYLSDYNNTSTLTETENITFTKDLIKDVKLYAKLKDTFLTSWNYSEGRSFVSHEEFIRWCKENGVKSSLYFKALKKPSGIPSNPHSVYKNFSWSNITGNIKKGELVDYEEFVKWCKENNIKSSTHFHALKRPSNIPSNPNIVYKNFSWSNITGNKVKGDFVDCKGFVKWCKENSVKSIVHFKTLKRPFSIPSTPYKVYKNFSWSSITGNKREGDFVDYEEFVKWCKENGVKSIVHFHTLKKPSNIPSAPHIVYKNFSWSNITGNKVKGDFVDHEGFVKWCKESGVKSHRHFKILKKPSNIPSAPHKVYKDFSWKDVIVKN